MECKHTTQNQQSSNIMENKHLQREIEKETTKTDGNANESGVKVDLVRQRQAGKGQAYVGITLARITLMLLVSNRALTGGGG